MALFVEVAKRKSFSQAAAALDVPISSLSRRITQFEATIGLRLLDRTTRKLVLTPYGEAYYEQAIRLVEEAQRTFDELIAQARGPSGLLKIAAPPDLWVIHHLSAVVSDFALQHAHVRVHVDLRPTMVDLAQEGYDLAIAVDEPRETSMITRKVAQLDNGLFAAPSYLAQAGAPSQPADLSAHQAIVLGPPTGAASTGSSNWRLSRGAEAATVSVCGAVSCNSQALARRFVIGGQGVALLHVIDAEADLQAGHLQRILPEWSPPPSPIYIITTSRLLPAKTRSFIEFASRQLAAQLMPRGAGFDGLAEAEAPEPASLYALRA
ncbi:LysR family transcriptional regulator [Methylobacterium crusticola]|nr:LysR family transcriptional regulator [Methylobacterium crusticola]